MCKGKVIVGCVLIWMCAAIVVQPVCGLARPDMKNARIDKLTEEDFLIFKDMPQKALYKEGEIIVKFKESAANKLEAAAVEKPSLSASLDALNNKHKVKKIEPVIKNFKTERERISNLQEKNESALTASEKHLLRRLKRAPKDAKVPDLGRIYKITLGEGLSAAKAAAEYRKNADVEYAELNYIVQTCATPNDPNYSPEQWALNNTGQSYPTPGGGSGSGTADCDIDTPEAWDADTGSSEIIVAVVDTGVDYNHEDLQQNMWFNSDEIAGNGIDDDDNGYIDDVYGYDFCQYLKSSDSDPIDDHGHGTHCAGTIAADGDNGLDITGVSWNSKIMAIKMLSSQGSGWTSDAVPAFYYAANNGADVISNSWGGGGYMQSLQDAIDYAVNQGAIVVAAAGNSNSSTIQYPAGYNNVIAVAATDSNDDKASFSIPPQSYGCKPVDEVIRRRRTGGACNLKCYGRKPVEIY